MFTQAFAAGYKIATIIIQNSIDTQTMATFAICVRGNVQRTDGFFPVYIRVTHNRKIAYIKTDKLVNKDGMNGKGEVKDPYVVQYGMRKIVEWVDALNRQPTEHWTVQELVKYLKDGGGNVSFSDYARQHIDRLFDNGQHRTSRNYKWATECLERFAGTNQVMFSMLTSAFLARWIKSLEHTNRAKEMYPVCVRQIFRAAIKELNDEERGIVKIKFNPWTKVQIPRADKAEKLAITPEDCRYFFNAPLPESKFKSPLPELGRDVAMMVLCLAGINTVDLYNLRKEDYHGGIIHYHRAKTKKFRADGAYMEMRVHPILRPLFEKYASDDEWLFNFHQRHTTSDSFSANVNIGIKAICESMGMPKERWYCVYTFRHTWGTIAQNDCGATISEVAFGMNHSAGHRITRGYIKLDFTPAWELNERLIELVFFTQIKGSRHEEESEVSFERFSNKQMMRGEVFFRGELLGKVEDIGFNNVDEIIRTLLPYIPDTVPIRSNVMFRITNCDKQQVAIYERQKGKGF